MKAGVCRGGGGESKSRICLIFILTFRTPLIMGRQRIVKHPMKIERNGAPSSHVATNAVTIAKFPMKRIELSKFSSGEAILVTQKKQAERIARGPRTKQLYCAARYPTAQLNVAATRARAIQ